METTPVSLEADYANALLPTLAPPQAIDLITARLRTARFSNEQLADWLREYVKIEQQYANSLSKLVKKPAVSDPQGWGQFLPVWQKVVDGLEENADASEVLGQKLAAEVESPIRAYATSASDWTDMRVLHERLSQVAITYKDLEARISKLRQKNSSSSKTRLAEATAEMDRVCQEWNRSSKFMYQLFETIEEKRWAFIKDILTREETLTVDRSQKVVAISERIFNALLSFEPSEETKAFCRGVIDKGPARYIGNAPSISGEGIIIGTGQDSQSTNSLEPHDSESHRSRSNSLVEPSASSSPHQSNLKSKMGTILGRGKNSPRKNRLSIFGGKKDREKKEHHDHSDGHSNGSRFGFSRSSVTASPSASSRHGHESDDGIASSNASVTSERGGAHSTRQPSNPTPARASTYNGTAAGAGSRNLPPAPPVSRRRSSLLMNSEVAQDSIPRDNGPHPKTITEEGAANLPLESPQDNVNGDDALNQMASSLRKNPTVSRRGPQRGRRESAQTSQPSTPTAEIANLTLRDIPSGEMAPRQPFAPGSGSFSGGNFNSETDTTSIHSHQSRTSSLSGPGSTFQHPVLASSGLSTSTVEFLQVALKHGQVTGTSVTMGEVAFHYEPESPEDKNSSFTVRIADPTLPSRISANTVFMFPESSGVLPAGPTLFSLNLPSLASYNSSLPIVGLKYVLNRTASDPRSLPPVIIKPLWRFEPNQASLIIDYGTSTGSPLEVADFLISASVEGANVVSAQSNPEGTFYKEKKRMIFKLGTVNVQPLSSPGAKQQRILCRFHTDSLAHEPSVGGVEVRFRISGLSPTVPGSVYIEKLAGPSGGGASETDPFSDSTPGSNTPSWVPLNGLKSVVAKRYTAAS